MAGNFFHPIHPRTHIHIRLTLLTQIVIFWEKQFCSFSAVSAPIFQLNMHSATFLDNLSYAFFKSQNDDPPRAHTITWRRPKHFSREAIQYYLITSRQSAIAVVRRLFKMGPKMVERRLKTVRRLFHPLPVEMCAMLISDDAYFSFFHFTNIFLTARSAENVLV